MSITTMLAPTSSAMTVIASAIRVIYDSAFGTRMRGSGEFATLIEKRFAIACRRFGLTRGRREHDGLDVSRFRPPARDEGRQQSLFPPA